MSSTRPAPDAPPPSSSTIQSRGPWDPPFPPLEQITEDMHAMRAKLGAKQAGSLLLYQMAAGLMERIKRGEGEYQAPQLSALVRPGERYAFLTGWAVADLMFRRGCDHEPGP